MARKVPDCNSIVKKEISTNILGGKESFTEKREEATKTIRKKKRLRKKSCRLGRKMIKLRTMIEKETVYKVRSNYDFLKEKAEKRIIVFKSSRAFFIIH